MHLATEATCNALCYIVPDIGMPAAGAIGYTPLARLLSLSFFHLTKYNSFCIHGNYGEREQCKARSRNTDLQCSMKESSPIQCFCDTGEKKQYKHRQTSRSQISCWGCIFSQRCRICSLTATALAREKGTQKWKLVIETDCIVIWKVFMFSCNVTKTTSITVFTQQPGTSLDFVRRYDVIVVSPSQIGCCVYHPAPPLILGMFIESDLGIVQIFSDHLQRSDLVIHLPTNKAMVSLLKYK